MLMMAIIRASSAIRHLASYRRVSYQGRQTKMKRKLLTILTTAGITVFYYSCQPKSYISEVNVQQTPSIASCHITNYKFTPKTEWAHEINQHNRDRRKTARKTSSASRLKLATLCSTFFHARATLLSCVLFRHFWHPGKVAKKQDHLEAVAIYVVAGI